MHHGAAVATAAQQSAQVHQARRIGRSQHLGTGARVVRQPVLPHACRNAGFAPGKRPPEAAALVLPFERDQLQAFQGEQQLSDRISPARMDAFARVPQAEIPKPVATDVEPYAPRELPVDPPDSQDLPEKLAEFEDFPRPAGAFPQFGAQESGVVLPHHGDTTRRGSDDILVVGKGALEIARERSRFGRNAGVPCRLATADRLFTQRNIHPLLLEDRNGSPAGFGVKLVHKAGNEEPDPHGLAPPRELDGWLEVECSTDGTTRFGGAGSMKESRNPREFGRCGHAQTLANGPGPGPAPEPLSVQFFQFPRRRKRFEVVVEKIDEQRIVSRRRNPDGLDGQGDQQGG